MQKVAGISLIFMFALSALLSWVFDGSRSMKASGTPPPAASTGVRYYRAGESQWVRVAPEIEQRYLSLADALTFARSAQTNRPMKSAEECKRSSQGVEILFPSPRVLKAADSMTDSYDRCFIPLDQPLDLRSAEILAYYGGPSGYAATPVIVRTDAPTIQAIASFLKRG